MFSFLFDIPYLRFVFDVLFIYPLVQCVSYTLELEIVMLQERCILGKIFLKVIHLDMYVYIYIYIYILLNIYTHKQLRLSYGGSKCNRLGTGSTCFKNGVKFEVDWKFF